MTNSTTPYFLLLLATTSLLLLLVVVPTTATNTNNLPTIYVSPEGNDTWSGLSATFEAASEQETSDNSTTKPEGPLRTLSAAVAAGRALFGPTVRKRILVAAGVYVQSTTLALTGADNNVVLEAVDKAQGRTLLSGGLYLPVGAFKPLDTSTALGGRVPQSARSHVVQVDLFSPEVGLTRSALGNLSNANAGMELFFKGGALRLARWPNYPTYVPMLNVTGSKGKDNKIGYVNETAWPTYKDVWVHGFFGFNWNDEHHAITDVDTTNKVIYMDSNATYAIESGMRFYYYNVIDELDAPGEYLIDRENGVLYFYPPSTIDSDYDAVLSLLNGFAVSMTNAANVSLIGFTVEATKVHGVGITGGDSVTIKNCTVRNVGIGAIRIAGGFNHLVMTTEIYGPGTTGITMTGGDRKTLTPANHMVFANHIHHYSRFILCYQAAISADGVGMKIINNQINSAPHNAIKLPKGNNNEVYFNEIFDVCRESGDVGAFYQGRDWTSQGTFVSYNYFHDIYGYSTQTVAAIYFDDENSGSTAFGNVISNMMMGVLMGGGRDNKVDNNIFMNVSYSYWADSRGLPTSSANASMMDTLLSLPYTVAPWSVQYPTLATILDDPVSPHAPRHNTFRHNVACNATRLQFFQGSAAQYLLNGTSENQWWNRTTGVADNCRGIIFPEMQARGSLAMDTAPAFWSDIGFSAIPWRRIGLAGAYEPLPDHLPGLKYGTIETPAQDADNNGEQSKASSTINNCALLALWQLLL